MEEKRPRGRPRLSEEEKARRKALRAAEKDAKLKAPEAKPVEKPKIPPEELAQIERVSKIMAEADARKRQQIVMPKIETEEQGNVELVHIAPAKEPTIDDEPKDARPEFVQDDERGWEPAT